MFKKILFGFGLVASTVIVGCAGANSGEVTGDQSADTADEELSNSICGGIAGIKCPTGYDCKLSGNYPDAAGKCVKARGEGAFCGGFAGIPCAKGYECQLKGNYPDAGGTCHKKGVCVQNVLCTLDAHFDSQLCQCVQNVTCKTLTCAKGYHCEMKGINGGSIGVCLKN